MVGYGIRTRGQQDPTLNQQQWLKSWPKLLMLNLAVFWNMSIGLLPGVWIHFRHGNYMISLHLWFHLKNDRCFGDIPMNHLTAISKTHKQPLNFNGLFIPWYLFRPPSHLTIYITITMISNMILSYDPYLSIFIRIYPYLCINSTWISAQHWHPFHQSFNQ